MPQGKPLLVALLALILILAAITAGVSLGAASIPLKTVWGVVADRLVPGSVIKDWSAGRESIVWDVRFPRVVLAALVGAGLAVVGAVLQVTTRNPLADPHLLGVSSGGACGAIFALLHTGMVFGLITVPLFAFLGALAATLAVIGVTRFSGSSAERLILSGVAVAFVATALSNLLIYLGDPRAVQSVVFWMLGGLGLAQWPHLLYPALVLAGSLAWLALRAREINGLAMGDETAATLGLPVARLRAQLFTVTALLTGVMVAFSGAIGFIGLMVPHVVRLFAGSDHGRVIPLSAAVGAIALVLADLAARTIMAPEDMPVGVITGFAGGLGFILLISRRPAA
ncbi:ABC transporter permease [Rhizobium rhizosphaerae]|uniref:ABC transporter permease n=1 Tax=Xaviernesmea rhizosphaerae TaxID=1672749 RepID=A0A1Q9AK71_9HYPH|nr:iron ABC transporter permease [Xaviernesmea rhizosphaerae]OLP55659.1 ABC transporter permease [Xaviernesmea rhizosphaerae]OQP86658.1 ABC transporter permease [Xaviernesmea rhizosphaerae]